MKKIIFPIVLILVVVLSFCIAWGMGLNSHSFLVGSWHASPSVAAGYNERFVFKSNGTYVYYPSEADGRDSTTGKWSVIGNELVILEKGKLFPTFMKIGALETESDEAVVYEKKVTIGENTYWKYSEETNLWNSKGELIIE